MKRILLFGILAFVLFVGATIWFGLSQLDGLVADAIETQGSEISGVPVRVGSVKIELAEGRGTISGLRVGNPEGFSAGDAFTLGEITVDIDPASITSSPVVIDALTVNAPKALFEMDARGRSNFDVIRENVERYSDSDASDSSGTGSGSGDGEESSEEVRLAIRKFRFEDGRVITNVSAVHEDAGQQELDLPPIALNDVGGRQGVTPSELGSTALDAFTKSVVGSVAKNEARKALEKFGGEAGKAAGELLDKLF